MVRETSVAKLSGFMLRLYDIYPDLKDWNYHELYKRTEETEDEALRRRYSYLRAREIEKTTHAIISFIEMDFKESTDLPNGYLKALLKYYLVLIDAKKFNLNFEVASDDILGELS